MCVLGLPQMDSCDGESGWYGQWDSSIRGMCECGRSTHHVIATCPFRFLDYQTPTSRGIYILSLLHSQGLYLRIQRKQGGVIKN